MDGKEKVLQKFDSYGDKKAHWKIYYGYAARPGDLVDSTEIYPANLDKALSREKLSDALDRLEPGEYLIQLKDASNSSGGNIINTRFKMGYESSGNRNNNQPVQMSGNKDYVSRETLNEIINARALAMEAKYQKKDFERRMEEMLKEMKELKKTSGGGVAEIAGAVKEVVGIFKGLTATHNQPVMIRGPKTQAPANNNNTTTVDQEKQDRINFFNKINAETMKALVDSEGGGDEGNENIIVLLYCLNRYREDNAVMWNTFKPEILKYAKELEEEEPTT